MATQSYLGEWVKHAYHMAGLPPEIRVTKHSTYEEWNKPLFPFFESLRTYLNEDTEIDSNIREDLKNVYEVGVL